MNVSEESQMTSKIIYEGNIAPVFGFQAVRLFYDNSTYTAYSL